MQVAVRVLAGVGHDDKVVGAGRVWGLVQTGRAEEAMVLRREANRALKALPSAAFPAVSHAVLTRTDMAEPLKRLALFWAVLRGRI